MAKIINTKTIGEVREIRRTTQINIISTVNTPVVITTHREVILCDEDDNIISQKPASAFTKTIPEVEDETITLSNGTTLSAKQVSEAVELFVEKWDDEILNPVTELPESGSASGSL